MGRDQDLDDFAGYIGPAFPADAVRPHHVDDWMQTKAWAGMTRRRAITSLKRAFSFGRKRKLIPALYNLFLDRFIAGFTVGSIK